MTHQFKIDVILASGTPQNFHWPFARVRTLSHIVSMRNRGTLASLGHTTYLFLRGQSYKNRRLYKPSKSVIMHSPPGTPPPFISKKKMHPAPPEKQSPLKPGNVASDVSCRLIRAFLSLPSRNPFIRPLKSSPSAALKTALPNPTVQ